MAAIGALVLLPLLLLMMEVFVRTWPRLRHGDDVGCTAERPVAALPHPRGQRPPDEPSLEAMLATEAATVHQLLGGQIDIATYHHQMHKLACRDELTRGAPS